MSRCCRCSLSEQPECVCLYSSIWSSDELLPKFFLSLLRMDFLLWADPDGTCFLNPNPAHRSWCQTPRKQRFECGELPFLIPLTSILPPSSSGRTLRGNIAYPPSIDRPSFSYRPPFAPHVFKWTAFHVFYHLRSIYSCPSFDNYLPPICFQSLAPLTQLLKSAWPAVTCIPC